jgi:hypothetical protein
MTHDELRSLVTAFSLDALGAADEAAVLHHLGECSDCGQELRGYLSVAGALALLADPLAPPASLRGRILAAGAEPQGSLADRTAAPATTETIEVPPRRRILARNGVGRRSYGRFKAALGTPGTGFPMTPAEGSTTAGTLYVGLDGRSGWLLASHLPDPGRQVYQVWAILDGTPAPVASFRPDGTGTALVDIPGGWGTLQPGMVAAVTLERRGGQPAPAGPMVMSSGALA